MKTKLSVILILLAFLASIQSVAAQGTAFVYQGSLNAGAIPAQGSYDFTFAIFNAATGGAQAGLTLTNAATAVSSGQFAVSLDFGAGIFNGTTYWLAISVRTNGNGTFIPLLPLQPITPVPYAIYAPNAGASLSAATAGTANSVAVNAVAATNIVGGQVVKSINGLHDAVVLAAGANITLSTAGNTMIVSSTSGGGGSGQSSAAWNLTGNAGTSPGLDFIGTTDAESLQLVVNGARALLLQSTYLTNAPNVVGGPYLNAASGVGDAIAGGYENKVYSSYGFIGGGSNVLMQSDFSVIGGGALNEIFPFSDFGFVGGGQGNNIEGPYDTIVGGTENAVTNGSSYCFLGGGQSNIIGAGEDGTALQHVVLVGGIGNTIFGTDSFIGGGDYNLTYEADSVIAGGVSNVITSPSEGPDMYDTISGGVNNTAGGGGATVPGGEHNQAQGIDSFCAGSHATAIDDHCFVWGTGGTGNNTAFASTANNQFLMGPNVKVGINTNNPQSTLDVNGNINSAGTVSAGSTISISNGITLFANGDIHAQGNTVLVGDLTAHDVTASAAISANTMDANTMSAGSFVQTSDRNLKEKFAPVDAQNILKRVVALPISSWNFKQDAGIRHIGPMAQDFYNAFSVGPDDRHITTVDEGGVALAAIQGLNQKLKQDALEKDAKIQILERKLDELEAVVSSLAQKK